MATAYPAAAGPPRSGLSTSTKMLLILTAALLPLGLIAFFASLQSAHTKRLQREADARVVATAEARQIDILLLRGSNLVRSTLSMGIVDASRCAALLQRDADALQAPVNLALFDERGRLRCATGTFDPRRLPPPRGGLGIDVLLTSAPASLRFTVVGPSGGYGVGELPVELLKRVLPTQDHEQGILLRQGSTRLVLSPAGRLGPLGRHLTVTAPVAGGQATLGLTIEVSPISAVEILLILLPLLMWAAAAAIGWIVVDQLLVRPLAQLQRAVTSYGRDGHGFALPRISGPAHEIRAMGEAFAATAGQLAAREAELEQGLSHQVRLTREVHHRVKNNLQVVASLINLHSRGTEGAVAAAYASIQRRVDALAVVHRNHYAELEENRGVALRSIIAELTANLRGTAPPAASHLTITLDMAPVFITQDVAVPVSFLVTELVELVMTCDPAGSVALTLVPDERPDRAVLTIAAPGLTTARCANTPGRDRFERIATGLSRQLRSQLEFDAVAGRYRIVLAILPQEPEPLPDAQKSDAAGLPAGTARKAAR